MLSERHLRIGVGAQACLVALAGVSILSGFGQSLPASATLVLSAIGVALPFTLLGAVIPDLDSSNSYVYHWSRPFVATCSAFCVFIFLYSARERATQAVQSTLGTASPAYLAGVASATAAVLTYFGTHRVVTHLLNKLTHRKLFHQLPTAVVLTLILYGIIVALLAAVDAPYPLTVGAIFAVAFFTGVISHLGADGLLFRRQTYIGETIDEKL